MGALQRPFAEAGQLIEADVLKLRGVVPVNIVLGIEIPKRDVRAGGKDESLVWLFPYRS